MGTQTQTKVIHHLNSQPSRQYDCLYDPLYTTSSAADHSRSLFRSQASVDRIKRSPIYESMFSELSHSPRFQLHLERRDPIPAWVNRQWRGYSEQMREAYFSQFGRPAAQGAEDVSGMHRYKYFRRPIIPFIPDMPAGLVLATQRQDQALMYATSDLDERPRTPATRNAQTQTDYRDGETQTDPYTPEYVIRPGEQPELLTLARLSFGRGLPAGLAEVEMIERARAKRAWEAQLPPLDDASQFDKRRRMMEEMEREEWAFREKEIEKLQEARLKVLIALLRKREESQQEVNRKRLDKTWGRMQEDKETQFANFRKKHVKALRRLLRDRTRFNQSLVPKRRDLAGDYSDPSSQVFAPLTRNGVFPDRFNEQAVVNNRFVNSYAGLLELERSLPDFVLQPRIRAPRAKQVTKDGFVKRAYREEQVLMEIHEHLKLKAQKKDQEQPPLRYLQKVEKPVPRPPTPSVPSIDYEEEERELAVIFLQQMIRGRAVQNMMFEGKEKRIELIRELRSTHALQEPEATQKALEQQTALALQRQRELHEHREALLDESLNALESEALSDMSDFLSKELIRLQEERRIHAFAMLAERRRRMREAEEAGRRQTEERRRREHDEVFKQTCKVHQNSVDAYLEDVILEAMNKAADERARSEVEVMAERINEVAYDVERTRTQVQSEEIVAEMVYQFLLPNVQKIAVRDRIRQQQRRLLNAAHKEIYGAANDIADSLGTERQPTPDNQDAIETERADSRPGSTRVAAATETEPSDADDVELSDTVREGSVHSRADGETEQQDQLEELARAPEVASTSADNTRPTSKSSVRFAQTRSEISETGDVIEQPTSAQEPPAESDDPVELEDNVQQ